MHTVNSGNTCPRNVSPRIPWKFLQWSPMNMMCIYEYVCVYIYKYVIYVKLIFLSLQCNFELSFTIHFPLLKNMFACDTHCPLLHCTVILSCYYGVYYLGALLYIYCTAWMISWNRTQIDVIQLCHIWLRTIHTQHMFVLVVLIISYSNFRCWHYIVMSQSKSKLRSCKHRFVTHTLLYILLTSY